MSRAATDALWRAARRFITILDANLAAEVTEDAVSGVNVSAPASGAYYLLPDARSCVEHVDNNNPRAYVYFDGEQTRINRTGGPTTRPVRQRFNVGVAFYVQEEAGAAVKTETWKDLTSKEREHRRAHILVGAAEDVLESLIRDGDDVLNITHVRTQVAPPDGSAQPRSGTWVHTVWTVDQIINVDQQN